MPDKKISKEDQDFIDSLSRDAKALEQDLADRDTGAIRFQFQFPSVDRAGKAEESRKALDKYGPEMATRIAKGGLDAALTGIALGTAPETGGGSIALREAARQGLPTLAKWVGGRALGGMTSAPARATFMGLSGLSGMDEPVGDFGGEVRNALGAVAAQANPLAKYLAPTGTMGREVFRAAYPFLENYGIHFAGKPFEGNHTLMDDSVLGIGPGLVSLLQSGMNVATGGAYKVNQRLPRTVGPESITKLEALVEGGQITPEEASKLANTIRSASETRVANTNVPGMFEPPKDLNFADFARERFAEISKMPTKTKEDVAARATASRQLLQDWESLINPNNSARVDALKKLQLGSVDPELESMLNPDRAFAQARAKGVPLFTRIDEKGGLQFAQPPFNSGLPGEQQTVGSMTTPPVMKMSALTQPLKREEKAAETVNQVYSWVNSAKHSPEYRSVMKDVLTNFRATNPGTLDDEALTALKTLKSTDNAKEFSQNLTKPQNLTAFNKYFGDDPRMKTLAQRQVLTEFIDDIKRYNGPKPASGDKVTGTILDKLTQHSPEEINKLFGRENAYQSLKDISESFQEAHKYLTDKGFRLEAKGLTWPLLWLGFMAGKQMGVDGSMVAPAAYGIAGVALAANEALAVKPAFLERLLDHNGAPARLLKEAWKNPEKNGRYLRVVSAYITNNFDHTEPNPSQPRPGQ